MNGAKIQLSAEELQLVQNAGWVLTKNKIIKQVIDMFGILSVHMQSSVQNTKLPAPVSQTTPKISKGENYKGLPYVMLDYPRLFTQEDVFAVRSFFWWGNYFSSTLHLKGRYKALFEDAVLRNRIMLAENDYHLSISNSEWAHEMDAQHYQPVKDMDREMMATIMAQQSFLKLSAKISLDQWGESELLLEKKFHVLLDATGINYPAGEKGL